MNRFTRFGRIALTPVLLFLLLGPSILADGGAGHQTQTTYFGSSGGSVLDRSLYYCCGGTLGSLVTDGVTKYILSNNHVLARTGLGRAGDDISQPGLIDNACRAPINIVGDLTAIVALSSSKNVDAAVAKLRTGTMDDTGYILDIGVPSKVVKAPSVGLAVAKSGRTTGFTSGSVSVVNATVTVQYQKGCGTGSLFSITFKNQVIINSTTFSAGGDSGSLIVTNNACHQPVALLFAGSSTTTVGNPISSVLTQVGSALRKTVSFVGTSCTSATTAPAATDRAEGLIGWPDQEAVDYTTRVMNDHVEDLMSLPAVIGVGVGASDTNTTDAVIVVFVDKTSGVIPELPADVNGVRVKVIFTDPFFAY